MPKPIVSLAKMHIKENIIVYFIVLLGFLIGISVGGFTVKVIDIEHKREIIAYLKEFFQVFSSEDLNSFDIFSQSVINNFQLMSLNWILGILIIGIPGVIFIIGFKGFVTGFTVGLLIEQFKFKGAMLFLFSVLPQNFIIIPIFIISSVISIGFSIMVLKSKLNKIKEMNFQKEFLVYTATYIGLMVFILLAASIETFISPIFIKIINKYI